MARRTGREGRRHIGGLRSVHCRGGGTDLWPAEQPAYDAGPQSGLCLSARSLGRGADVDAERAIGRTLGPSIAGQYAQAALCVIPAGDGTVADAEILSPHS